MQVSKKDLSCEPIKIKKTNGIEAWFFEWGNGINVYIKFRKRKDVGAHIPLSSIRAYLRRLDK
jgi:hypothetical protein